MSAPLYVSISRLTVEELSENVCPDGIFVSKVPRICKGGGGIFNEGFGWLVFLQADKRDKNDSTPRLIISNKKFIHYNDDVLLPFLR